MMRQNLWDRFKVCPSLEVWNCQILPAFPSLLFGSQACALLTLLIQTPIWCNKLMQFKETATEVFVNASAQSCDWLSCFSPINLPTKQRITIGRNGSLSKIHNMQSKTGVGMSTLQGADILGIILILPRMDIHGLFPLMSVDFLRIVPQISLTDIKGLVPQLSCYLVG